MKATTVNQFSSSKSADVTGTSAKLAAALTRLQKYRISSDVGIWYKFAATDGSVAAKDDDAILVPAGTVVLDTPVDATKLFIHFIRAGGTSGVINVAAVVD